MKIINKIVAVILSGAMASGAVFCSACTSTGADNKSITNTYSLSAASGSVLATVAKEEVIYINLDANGTIKDAYVVNIVGGGNTVDYGDYEWVKILNTADKITQEGDKITFSSSAERVYYEGKLKKIELPWNISIRYFIDGTEYPAKEVAGKSGRLEIKFKVSKNENSTGSFYESFALQASFTLNTQKFKNLSAPNATVANVGKNKQISYTILPGNGIDTSITADVTDFEMSAVAINGVPLSLNMEIDDSELTDKIGEIQNAVSGANDGAAELKDGLDELAGNNQSLIDGANGLKDGLGELDGNSISLTDGAGKLKDGLEILGGNSSALLDGAGGLKDGLTTLDENSNTLNDGSWQAYCGLCTAAQEIINASLSANGFTTVALTPETYEAVLTQLTASLDEDEVRAQVEQTARQQITEQVENNALAVYVEYLKVSENKIYAQYVKSIEEEIYAQYVKENADDIYYAYIKSQNDANDDILYKNFAYDYVIQQATESGMSESEAIAYAASEQGQAQIAAVYANLTDEDKSAIILAAVDELTYRQMKELLSVALSGLTDAQKEAILTGAIEALTDEQKQAILEGVANSLSDAQKTQIRAGYIEQVMASEEVTAQIDTAVAEATAAKEQIAQLKAQLDEFGTLYDGIVDYTDGVSQALDGVNQLYDGIVDYTDGVSQVQNGAAELAEGISEYTNGVSQALDGAGELCEGILEYTDGVSTAADGAKELKDGLQEFYDQTLNMDTEIADKIQQLIDETTGSGYEISSFVSDKNTEVNSVQFVIQTDAIEIPSPPAPEKPQEEQLTFWDKFLRLFGVD